MSTLSRQAETLPEAVPAIVSSVGASSTRKPADFPQKIFPKQLATELLHPLRDLNSISYFGSTEV